MTITISVFLSLIAGGLVVFLFMRARIGDKDKIISDQQKNFGDALSNMELTFKGLSSEVLKESREEFLKQADPKIAEHIRPLQDALKRYDEAIRIIENKREEAYGGLSKHLHMLSDYTQQLKDETGNLKNALKSTTVRGRWGEVTLKRIVELSGMSEHCDFDEQASVTVGDTRLRPDMIVHIPGGRNVVVDAKAPLDAYLKAVESTNERDRAAFMGEHAKAVREHMRRLGQKAYWEQFDSSTDLVVMFLPGESFAAAVLEVDRSLFEDGMRSKVVLATPATLVALLRSFAMGWQQECLAENAQKISDAGKELFDRFDTFADHFNKVGKSLDNANKFYNNAVRSWESRVLPGAKRLKELGATKSPDAGLPEMEQVETMPHQLMGEV